MNYDLSALEILQILGCTPAADYQPDKRLPAMLNDFLSRIVGNPLFDTSNIWHDDSFYFLYEEIAEGIEEDADYWQQHPEEWQENEYYPFAQTPEAEWPQLMPDYLKIGSDYSAGVINFAIKKEDLGQENPPVYMHHEADDVRTWNKFSATLADFLIYILCGNVLACEDYDTAQQVLTEAGWTYTECDKPENIGRQYDYVFGLAVACGYDAATNTLLPVLIDHGCKAYKISK